MKTIIFTILIIISFFGIPVFYFSALNTGISLKYEAEVGQCISEISGINLCKQQDIFLVLSLISGIIFIVLLSILIRKTLIKLKKS